MKMKMYEPPPPRNEEDKLLREVQERRYCYPDPVGTSAEEARIVEQPYKKPTKTTVKLKEDL